MTSSWLKQSTKSVIQAILGLASIIAVVVMLEMTKNTTLFILATNMTELAFPSGFIYLIVNKYLFDSIVLKWYFHIVLYPLSTFISVLFLFFYSRVFLNNYNIFSVIDIMSLTELFVALTIGSLITFIFGKKLLARRTN